MLVCEDSCRGNSPLSKKGYSQHVEDMQQDDGLCCIGSIVSLFSNRRPAGVPVPLKARDEPSSAAAGLAQF